MAGKSARPLYPYRSARRTPRRPDRTGVRTYSFRAEHVVGRDLDQRQPHALWLAFGTTASYGRGAAGAQGRD